MSINEFMMVLKLMVESKRFKFILITVRSRAVPASKVTGLTGSYAGGRVRSLICPCGWPSIPITTAIPAYQAIAFVL